MLVRGGAGRGLAVGQGLSPSRRGKGRGVEDTLARLTREGVSFGFRGGENWFCVSIHRLSFSLSLSLSLFLYTLSIAAWGSWVSVQRKHCLTFVQKERAWLINTPDTILVLYCMISWVSAFVCEWSANGFWRWYVFCTSKVSRDAWYWVYHATEETRKESLWWRWIEFHFFLCLISVINNGRAGVGMEGGRIMK